MKPRPLPTLSECYYFEFAPVTATDIKEIIALESLSYHPDEAASPERLTLRANVAAEYFYVARAEGRVIGYVCGTRAPQLNPDAMAGHVPGAPILCIHSVVVAPDLRRRGIALRMLQLYLAAVASLPQAPACIQLLTKPDHQALYAKAGFRAVGPWAYEHGPEAWLLMERL